MNDPVESSQIFEASSRLQSAATALRKLRQGKSLNTLDRHNLKWSGRFLEEVDWEARGKEAITSEYAVQATEVRPSFYTTLQNLEPVLREAGLNNAADRHEFFSSIYHFLTRSGRLEPKQALSPNKMDLAAVFLEQLSVSLLLLLIETPRRSGREPAESLLSCSA